MIAVLSVFASQALCSHLRNGLSSMSAHAHPPYEGHQIPPPVHVQFVDWVLGICSFLGMLIIDLVGKDRIIMETPRLCGGHAFFCSSDLLSWLATSGLAGIVSLLVLKYDMMDYPERYTYHGYANVSQNVALMLSAVVL